MERIWAPWRMEYIKTASKEKGCLFCIKNKGENNRKNLVVYKGEYAFVIMNRFPYNSGHLMVAPLRHVADIENLREKEGLEFLRLISLSIKVLKKLFKPMGFNLGINLGRVAGAGVLGHIHIHIVPRWEGDTNFMPVLSNIKVIPEALDTTYEKIYRGFLKFKRDHSFHSEQ